MTIIVGDSIALGLAAYLPYPVHARAGIGSRAGAKMIQRYHDPSLIVDLGVNDKRENLPAFWNRIRHIMEGRVCVVWFTMRRHPGYNAELKIFARNDSRLHVVNGIVKTIDGINPTSVGYNVLMLRANRVSC